MQPARNVQAVFLLSKINVSPYTSPHRKTFVIILIFFQNRAALLLKKHKIPLLKTGILLDIHPLYIVIYRVELGVLLYALGTIVPVL